ncbi:MAG: hypothetical protein AAF203_00405 [Pseudomonadota bacterium]
MDKLSWIKDLVRNEQEMEESGVVEFSTGFKPEKQLLNETLLFLINLKQEFVDAATSFNQLKGSPMGRIKVYSISQTQADFMLFRNGFKLVFSMTRPGTISMKFLRSSGLNPAIEPNESEEEFLMAKWGPFGDLVWAYNNQPIKKEYLIKYYTTRFVHESAK